MTLAASTQNSVLLALKIAFLVLLYLFIWRVARAAKRELRLPQDSLIVSAAEVQAEERDDPPLAPAGFLVVLSSPALGEEERYEIDGRALTIGRGPLNELRLDDDEFASSRHALVEGRNDGAWIEDLGSTNGTWVNGARLEGTQLLVPGDVIRIGETDFRYET
ncbi:MAG: FHA domain-containing protein [Gaiellaceae bacterium]